LVIFQKIIEKNVSLDDVTFLSLLTACSNKGNITRGYNFFNQMEFEFGVVPNVKHYTTMVTLIGRAANSNEAYRLLMRG